MARVLHLLALCGLLLTQAAGAQHCHADDPHCHDPRPHVHLWEVDECCHGEHDSGDAPASANPSHDDDAVYTVDLTSAERSVFDGEFATFSLAAPLPWLCEIVPAAEPRIHGHPPPRLSFDSPTHIAFTVLVI